MASGLEHKLEVRGHDRRDTGKFLGIPAWAFKNPVVTFILGMFAVLLVISGFWKNLLPVFGLELKGSTQVVEGPPAPMACTKAMTEMRDALKDLQSGIEAQDKRMDQFERKLDHIDTRLDDLADRRHSEAPHAINWAAIDKALDAAAARGDLPQMNRLEAIPQ